MIKMFQILVRITKVSNYITQKEIGKIYFKRKIKVKRNCLKYSNFDILNYTEINFEILYWLERFCNLCLFHVLMLYASFNIRISKKVVVPCWNGSDRGNTHTDNLKK